MSDLKESPLFARAYDLVRESCIQSERFPRARRAVLGRPLDERADLACELLASLEGEDEKGAEAWRDEVARRAEEVREGRVQLVDGAQAFESLRQRLRRP